jgi:large subunit ribosomal protein L3
LTVDAVFKPGDLVDVTGITKGRGYTGVVKRHRFSGFPASHGTHEYFRHGGSIGNRSFPGRVFKNKRMAGHYGTDRVTTQNIEIIAVRPGENLLLVRGAVPGARGGVVEVRPAVKAKTHG